MFGKEMTMQDDSNTALAIPASDLMREPLFPATTAYAARKRVRVEEAQRRSLPAGHLCATLDQPHQQSVGWAWRFGWNG